MKAESNTIKQRFCKLILHHVDLGKVLAVYWLMKNVFVSPQNDYHGASVTLFATQRSVM